MSQFEVRRVKSDPDSSAAERGDSGISGEMPARESDLNATRSLLRALRENEFSHTEVAQILRQVAIGFEHIINHIGVRERIDLCEEVASSLLSTPLTCWRAAVSYLNDAIALRCECALAENKFDSAALSLKMIVIDTYRDRADCDADFKLFGGEIKKAIALAEDFCKAFPNDDHALYRAISIAHDLTEHLPICFEGGIRETRRAIEAMLRMTGSEIPTIREMVSNPVWCEGKSPIACAFIWGALANYEMAQARRHKEFDNHERMKQHVNLAFKAAQNHYYQLRGLADEIQEEQQEHQVPQLVLVEDAQGRKIELGKALSTDVLFAAGKITKLAQESGEYSIMDVMLNYVTDNSSLMSEGRFEEVSKRIISLAVRLSGENELQRATSVMETLGRACRNREHPLIGEAFAYYEKAIEYAERAIDYTSEISIIWATATIIRGMREFRSVKERAESYAPTEISIFVDRDFPAVARYLVKAYKSLLAMSDITDRDEDERSPFAEEVDYGQPVHRPISVHPFVKDPTSILKYLLDFCDSCGLGDDCHFRITAHVYLGESYQARNKMEVALRHLDQAYEGLGGASGNVPELTRSYLANTWLKLGILFREQGSEHAFRALSVLEQGYLLLAQDSNAQASRTKADLLFHIANYKLDQGLYGEGIKALRQASLFLNPEERTQDRLLALRVWHAWGEAELKEGDADQGRNLLLRVEEGKYDWRLADYF